MDKGCRYGTHRVITPEGTLPQPALKLDNTMSIYDNELLIDVQTLNIDSASYTQIKSACNGNADKMKEMILSIVAERGKMQNPVTGSGGMLIGTVKEIGPNFPDKSLKVGDKIATLVSLSLTPLKINKIKHLDPGAPARAGDPAGARTAAGLRLCLRRRRAERCQRHDRHRADLRQLRRAARRSHVLTGQIPLFRPAHGPRAGRGGHHRQPDPAQRVHLRRGVRLSGGDRLGLLHGRCRDVRIDGIPHRADRIRRRDRHGAPSRPDVRSHLRPCADSLHRAQRRRRQARHRLGESGPYAGRHKNDLVRHGRAHDVRNRRQHEPRLPRNE